MYKHTELAKDDEDWLALMAGQQVPDATPETVQEAALLRMVLSNKENLVPANHVQRMEALLHRVREEETRKSKSRERSSTCLWNRLLERIDWLMHGVPVIASILFVLTGVMWADIFLRQPPYEEKIVARNTLKHIVRLSALELSADEEAKELIYAFRRAKLDATMWPDEEAGEPFWNIYIPIPASLSDQADGVLKQYEDKYGFTVPPERDILLKIAKRHITVLYEDNPRKQALVLKRDFEKTGAVVTVKQINPTTWQLSIQLADLEESDPRYKMLADLMGENNAYDPIEGMVYFEARQK